MSQQRHVINKQILEIHVSEKEDIDAVQADISRLFQEKLVPIIDALCDQHSAAGTHCKVEKLTIDLGKLQIEDFEEVFAEKFAEAIAVQEVEIPESSMGEANGTKSERQALDAIAYFLKTGTMPWWIGEASKEHLHQLLDQLNASPNATFKAFLRQVGQHKAYRERFLQTFSETQIQQSFTTLTGVDTAQVLLIKREFQIVVLQLPSVGFAQLVTPQSVAHAFWTAAFAHIATTNDVAGLASYAVQQSLQILGADVARVQEEVENWPSPLALKKLMGNKGSRRMRAQMSCFLELKKLRQRHPENDLLQAFCKQVSELLQHPAFVRINSVFQQEILVLLKNLVVAQASTNKSDPRVLRVVTETNLVPLSRQLPQLRSQLKQASPAPPANVMESLHSDFDETDFVAVQNAGLVILWPFLQRFFKNLDLLTERKFTDEAARHKAAGILQYLADEEEEGVFEGLLTLNKVICGIDILEPIALEPLSHEEKEIAQGLLEAVAARGPNWKNLSVSGLRTSYLQREGLLRSRDGHWLLQVKKETYDITLENLPWSFSTVKLPWMNEILIVEWI